MSAISMVGQEDAWKEEFWGGGWGQLRLGHGWAILSAKPLGQKPCAE